MAQQIAAPVDYGDDEDIVTSDAVEKPIALDDQLTDCRMSVFRNDSTQLRIESQTISSQFNGFAEP